MVEMIEVGVKAREHIMSMNFLKMKAIRMCLGCGVVCREGTRVPNSSRDRKSKTSQSPYFD